MNAAGRPLSEPAGGRTHHPITGERVITVPDQKAIDRFWPKVNKTEHCWIWTSTITKEGYGRFSFQGRQIPAHRFSYLLVHGDIPAGLHVDHLCHGWDETCMAKGNFCRHRACVNPDHLEAVTPQVNQLRGRGVSAQAAKRTHCPQGHPYDEANTWINCGRRRCRTCLVARGKGNSGRGHNSTRTHCPQGHPYSDENTYRAPNGNRKCRTCRRAERQRRHVAARAAREAANNR